MKAKHIIPMSLSFLLLPLTPAATEEPPKAPDAQIRDLSVSRGMTPEELEIYGYKEHFRQEEEKRQKEAARFLPGFAKLQPMLARISADQEPLVFEGLPLEVIHPDEYAAELKTKETVTRHGIAFYKTPIKLNAKDVNNVTALIKQPDAFAPYQALSTAGRFQPDFSLVWSDNGKPIEIQVCFNNGGEVKVYHENEFVYCQLEEIRDALKSILKKYHQSLPQSTRLR